jgi:hypothetical protein
MSATPGHVKVLQTNPLVAFCSRLDCDTMDILWTCCRDVHPGNLQQIRVAWFVLYFSLRGLCATSNNRGGGKFKRVQSARKTKELQASSTLYLIITIMIDSLLLGAEFLSNMHDVYACGARQTDFVIHR